MTLAEIGWWADRTGFSTAKPEYVAEAFGVSIRTARAAFTALEAQGTITRAVGPDGEPGWQLHRHGVPLRTRYRRDGTCPLGVER